MSTDRQRDADIDRLLRATLRREADAAAGTCPEPQALAAYVEDAMAPAERDSLERHVAACGRCQSTLALMATDEDDALAARVGVTAGPDPLRGRRGWFWWWSQVHPTWFVPATAVATLAIVYVATRPLIAPDEASKTVPAAQLAQDRVAVAPSETVRSAESLPPAAPLAAKGDARKQAAADKPASVAESVAREKVERTAPAAAPAPAAVAAAPAAVTAAPSVATEAAPAPPAQVLGANVASRPTMAPNPAAVDAMRDTGASAAAGARPGAASKMEARREAGEPDVVMAPGGHVRWRLGTDGSIARSADGGANWFAQHSGVTARLLAGSAPAEAVCWVVGAAGTVLLSDDGERWVRRAFPEPVDLVEVVARTSHAATVTARDGRQFATSDGGRTWSAK